MVLGGKKHRLHSGALFHVSNTCAQSVPCVDLKKIIAPSADLMHKAKLHLISYCSQSACGQQLWTEIGGPGKTCWKEVGESG